MVPHAMLIVMAAMVFDGKPEFETRLEENLAEYAKVQKTIESITDRATADKAMKELQGFKDWPQMKPLKNAGLTKEKINSNEWKRQEAAEMAQHQIYMALSRIEEKDERLERAIAISEFGKSILELRKETLNKKAKNIKSGYQAYWLRSGGANWPKTVDELIKPSDGGRPYLSGGESANTNPWGKPYQVRIVETKAGPEPVVSTSVPFPKKWTLLEEFK